MSLATQLGFVWKRTLLQTWRAPSELEQRFVPEASRGVDGVVALSLGYAHMEWPAKFSTIMRLLGRKKTMNKARAEALLSASLANVDSPAGRKRLARYLQGISFPHYEPLPGGQDLLLRIDADGKRTMGRFVNRKFVTAKKRGM